MKFVIKMMLPLTMVIQTHAQTVLRFQDHITHHAQKLGDLILVSKDRQELMSIPLDSHPRAGDQINEDQIIQWLSKKVELLNYQWRGKKTAIVEQVIQSKGYELLHKAQTALESQLKNKYESVELKAKGAIKDSEFPLSDFTVQLPDHTPPSSQLCVRLNRNRHSIPIWFTVKAYQTVLVAKKPIKSHSQLHQADFILKKHNIAGLKDNPLTQLPPSFWLKKSINKDHILLSDDVVHKPQILKGQWVQVMVLNHKVSITSKAIAQNDGYIGQVIRMKNPSSHKYFVAEITGPGQAEISS